MTMSADEEEQMAITERSMQLAIKYSEFNSSTDEADFATFLKRVKRIEATLKGEGTSSGRNIRELKQRVQAIEESFKRANKELDQ